MCGVKDKRKRVKSSVEKKRKKDKLKGESHENTENKVLKNRKQRAGEETDVVELNSEKEDVSSEQKGVANEGEKKKKSKAKDKRRKKQKKAELDVDEDEAEHNSEQQNDDGMISSAHSEIQGEIESSKELNAAGRSTKISNSKKAHKKKKNRPIVSKEEDNLLQNRDDVYQISSGDEDYSKGMKKWIMAYHERRPGLNVLQERIDDFITAHEARVEQERKEREAQAAEDGWTVVVHHKGRKKTTDETGVAVGSVTQASVVDKVAKKKNTGVGLDFYRFQKREARRNEIMMLQSKFEQDKKRIQQLRAARKFRPY